MQYICPCIFPLSFFGEVKNLSDRKESPFLGDDEKRKGSGARVILERPLSVGKEAVPPYQLTRANFYDAFSLDVRLDAGNASHAAYIRKVSRLLSQQISAIVIEPWMLPEADRLTKVN